MMRGIDVSKWQKDVDINKVRASGIEFVIIRAGYGKAASQKDAYFEKNYERAKAAGLHVGAYWYSYADSVDSALLEAKACLSVLKGKQFDMPVYFDVEESKQFARGRKFIDSIVSVFCNALEDAGYYAGLYMSTSYLTNNVSDNIRRRYTIWVAQYNTKCTYKGDYGIWQYSSKGRVNGVNGNCDMNECYQDFPSIIRKDGYNGYKKGGQKSIDEISREVIDGKWGNGNERRQRLADAGYDYSKVQERVNDLLK